MFLKRLDSRGIVRRPQHRTRTLQERSALASDALRSLESDGTPPTPARVPPREGRAREHEDRSRATGLTVVSGVPNKRLSIIVLVKNSAFQRRRASRSRSSSQASSLLCISSLHLLRLLRGRRRAGATTRGTKYSPCNFFSVSQNFWSSVKYLSRMKTLESPRVAILTAGVGSAAPAELVAATLGHRAARDRVPRTWVGSAA